MANTKIVFHTQYCENYGAHAWDGTGECPQHWKNKGGSTYVVESPELMEDPAALADIRKLIAYKNDYSEAYIIHEREAPLLDIVCEEWETIQQIFRNEDGKYRVKSVNDNRDHGSMRSEIAFKTVEAPLGGGDPDDYFVEYELTNGRFAHSDEQLKVELTNMGVKF